MKKLEITIEPEDSDVRIDKWISDTIPDFSRSYIQKCISEGCISVNGKTACKSSTKLCTGDELVFDVCADEKEELISAARDVMENIVNLNVPLKVSTDVGTDLYEAK